MNATGSSSRREQDAAGAVAAHTQAVAPVETKLQAKSRDMDFRRGSDDGDFEVGSKTLLIKLNQLHIDGHLVDAKVAGELMLCLGKQRATVQRKVQGPRHWDLQIPLESHIQYWLATNGTSVTGFLVDGKVTQNIRNEWYGAIPSTKPEIVLQGLQRFLIFIELETPVSNSVIQLVFPTEIKCVMVTPSALVNAYANHRNGFKAEREAPRVIQTTNHKMPRPSISTEDAAPRVGATSSRPKPKRKVPSADLNLEPGDEQTQTRLQPDRTARTLAVSGQAAGKYPNKAVPPAHPDLPMREWPTDGRTEIVITEGDFYKLEKGEYLNDTLIEFGLKRCLYAAPNESNGLTSAFTRNDIHLFDSYFYKKLAASNKIGYKEANPDGISWPAYDEARKKTDTVDIFEKDMLLIPINENLHWYLAVIFNPAGILSKIGAKSGADNNRNYVDAREEKRRWQFALGRQLSESDAQGGDRDLVDSLFAKQKDDSRQSNPETKFSPDEPCIMVFDSLGGEHPNVPKKLNRWLVYEAIHRKKAGFRLTHNDWSEQFPAAYRKVRAPGQDNFEDCGLYLIHYAIQLMQDDGQLREYIFDDMAANPSKEIHTPEDIRREMAIWNAENMEGKREYWKAEIREIPLKPRDD